MNRYSKYGGFVAKKRTFSLIQLLNKFLQIDGEILTSWVFQATAKTRLKFEKEKSPVKETGEE
jgi:hypothetical protein